MNRKVIIIDIVVDDFAKYEGMVVGKFPQIKFLRVGNDIICTDGEVIYRTRMFKKG